MIDNSKSAFNISGGGTEEQKVQFEEQQQRQNIAKIQTPELRESLQDLVSRRDALITAKERKLKEDRDKIAQRMVGEYSRPTLKPIGQRGASDAERRRTIDERVKQTYLPDHQREVLAVRRKINAEINKEITAALEYEKSLARGPSESRSPESASMSQARSKLEKLRENSRDITQKLGKSSGLGRGRSR